MIFDFKWMPLEEDADAELRREFEEPEFMDLDVKLFFFGLVASFGESYLLTFFLSYN
jgi:hypothetical protein